MGIPIEDYKKYLIDNRDRHFIIGVLDYISNDTQIKQDFLTTLPKYLNQERINALYDCFKLLQLIIVFMHMAYLPEDEFKNGLFSRIVFQEVEKLKDSSPVLRKWKHKDEIFLTAWPFIEMYTNGSEDDDQRLVRLSLMNLISLPMQEQYVFKRISDAAIMFSFLEVHNFDIYITIMERYKEAYGDYYETNQDIPTIVMRKSVDELKALQRALRGKIRYLITMTPHPLP